MNTLTILRQESQQKEEMSKQEAPSSSKELLELREANDNLKTLLNNAEKKYSHLASINSELQKRIDLIEQQSQVHNESMYMLSLYHSCRSINMRSTRTGSNPILPIDTPDSEETPLLSRNVYF